MRHGVCRAWGLWHGARGMGLWHGAPKPAGAQAHKHQHAHEHEARARWKGRGGARVRRAVIRVHTVRPDGSSGRQGGSRSVAGSRGSLRTGTSRRQDLIGDKGVQRAVLHTTRIQVATRERRTVPLPPLSGGRTGPLKAFDCSHKTGKSREGGPGRTTRTRGAGGARRPGGTPPALLQNGVISRGDTNGVIRLGGAPIDDRHRTRAHAGTQGAQAIT